MESSHNGMQSLERRVRGLETSFSVISTDLLVSRSITQNGNHKRNACRQNWKIWKLIVPTTTLQNLACEEDSLVYLGIHKF